MFDKVEPGTRLRQRGGVRAGARHPSARDFEEALRLANDVQFGLTASIYTRDY